MNYLMLKIGSLALFSFLGTCFILYFNPRFDWITIFWLFVLTLVSGFLYFLWERTEKIKLDSSVDNLLNLLHAVEGQVEDVFQQEGYFSVLQDEIKKSLVSQRNVRDQALRAREQLKQNMEDITHQIKTPLTGVLLFLELLESDPQNAREYQKRIRQEIEHLYDLSNLLLKLSSFDAGSIELRFEEFSARSLIIDVELSLEQLFEQKGLHLEISGNDFMLKADRMWLMEALLNIVRNAVEAAPLGSKVSIALQTNAIFQSIIVRDQGTGLSLEQQKRVFERFYKADPKSLGFGIGLSLAKSIILQHEGEILLRSTPLGSEFELRFYPVTKKHD